MALNGESISVPVHDVQQASGDVEVTAEEPSAIPPTPLRKQMGEIASGASKETVPRSLKEDTMPEAVTAIQTQKVDPVPAGGDGPFAPGKRTNGEVGDVKGAENHVLGTTAASVPLSIKTGEVKFESVPVVLASGITATSEASAKEVGEGVQPTDPSTTTTIVPPAVGVKTEDVKADSSSTTVKTEQVKVESISVSTVVAGVVEDLKDATVGVANEGGPLTEHDDSPSFLDTMEGGLQIVEKEVVKGAGEVITSIEQHPELIAEGALAGVLGVASLVQPELLPGSIAVVGKMAMDNAKKKATKIATDEAKKIGTAIEKDISNDAKKEREAHALHTNGEKAGTDEKPAEVGGLEKKVKLADTAKDTPKVGTSDDNPVSPKEIKQDANGGHTVSIEVSQKLAKSSSTRAEGKLEPQAPPVSLKMTIGRDGDVKAVTQTRPAEPKATYISLEREVSKATETNELVNGSTSKVFNTPEETNETSILTSKQPLIPQRGQETLGVAAISSVSTTTKTMTKTIGEERSDIDKIEEDMVTISKESLDLLHQKLDAMHDAIKLITETLALHLPPRNPTTNIGTTNQSTATSVQSEQSTSKPKMISVPSEVAPALTSEPSAASTADTLVEPSTPQSPPKRPSLEKRTSILGSMGKIFWPFGSSSSTKTAIDGTEIDATNADAPTVPTVTVSVVQLTPGIEI